ncbi:MAG: hypothetical protein HOV86_00195 [Thermoactinospora sp.]|nr:hypothetical protein [Thermoactinospora sp.]
MAESEQPGMSGQSEHYEFVNELAGYVGAHEAIVGSDTDNGSLNVPYTVYPGAEANAMDAQRARTPEDVFVPAQEGGDVTDVLWSDEEAAARRHAVENDPALAAEAAVKSDLTGE